MGIAELAPLHKKQRLIRRHQLANSKDPRVRQIHNDLSEYQAQRDKRGSLKRGTNEWKECVEMDKLLAEVKTNKIKGSAQTNRAGLGYGPRRRGILPDHSNVKVVDYWPTQQPHRRSRSPNWDCSQ